jgi:effector-binding domain-containing protein
MKTLNNYISEALIKKDTKIDVDYKKILSKLDFVKAFKKYDLEIPNFSKQKDFIKIYPKGAKIIHDGGLTYYYPSTVIHLTENKFEDQRTFLYNLPPCKTFLIYFLDKDGIEQNEKFEIEKNKFDIENDLFLYTKNNIEQLAEILKQYMN